VKEYALGGAPEERVLADLQNEKYWVGLRLSEGVLAGDRFGDEISRLVSDGLLKREGERIRLTSRGVLVSNDVFQEFLG
jgi:oxygen-independent coproporphyrinogen-3 oxidase